MTPQTAPPGEATLRLIDGTDHGSEFGPEEFWKAFTVRKRVAFPFHNPCHS